MAVNPNLYTKIDYEKEEKCQTALLKIEKKFRDFHSYLEDELIKQEEIIDKIWVLSQRLLILQKGVPCGNPYPPYVAREVINRIESESHSQIKEIHQSNRFLQTWLEKVETKIKKFDDLTRELPFDTESTFIQGSQLQQPIFYYIEMVDDIYSYFRKFFSKMKMGALMLKCNDVVSIETYKNLLKISNEYDGYVNFSLCQCKDLTKPI